MAARAYGALPLTSVNPSKIGAQSTNVFDTTSWRPLQWLTPPQQENMQQKENDAALWTLLEKLPVKPAPVSMTNPSIHWRVDNRLNRTTYLNALMSAADTYISVAEPLLCKTGYILHLPESNQQVLVADVDSTLGEGWVNDAAVACNVQITRTTLPGPNVAAAANAAVLAGVPLMGEQGEPKEGITTVPGDPRFNFCQLTGLWVKMTRMQKNSLMAGDYGTHEHLLMENDAFLNEMIQTTLLHGRKGTVADADEGQIYLCDGLIHQCQDNVLDAGGVGNSLVYENISNFWDGLFESANSSASKIHCCGERQFMNLLTTANQEGVLTTGVTYNPNIGVDEFSVRTGGGKNVSVMKMRFAFQKPLDDWGITLDLGNLTTAEYAGFGWKWIYDLEIPMRAITTITDAIVGSLCVIITDSATCGLMRGGTNRVLSRNDLGPVTELL